MKEITVKIDSKGRMTVPPKIRKAIGNNPILKKTPQGYLIIPNKQQDAIEELRKIINSKHRRTGKPTLVTPEEMKSIWNPER